MASTGAWGFSCHLGGPISQRGRTTVEPGGWGWLAREVRPRVCPTGPSELLSLSAGPCVPAASRPPDPSHSSARGGSWLLGF